MGSPAPSPFCGAMAPRTPRIHPDYRVTGRDEEQIDPRVATLRDHLCRASMKSAIHTVLPHKVQLSRFDPLNRPRGTKPDGV